MAYRRIEQQTIRLPSLENGSGVTERDISSLIFATYKALPLLGDVSKAFSEALTERARIDAEEAVGFVGELIEGPFAKTYPVGDHLFAVSFFRDERSTSPKLFVDRLSFHLESLRDRPPKSLGRRVSAVGTPPERYADLGRFLEDAQSMQAAQTVSTKSTIRHVDENGKPVELDGSITAFNVDTDTSRYRRASAANADAYYEAKSLEDRIKGFVSETKKRFEEYFALPPGESVQAAFDDGSAARLLFFERPTPSYAKIASSLIGTLSPTGKVAVSTGDLRLIAHLGPEAKHSSSGKTPIVVTSERLSDEDTRVAIMRGDVEVAYRVNEHRGLAVALADIITGLSLRTAQYTSTSGIVKSDFFPPTPEYLR